MSTEPQSIDLGNGQSIPIQPLSTRPEQTLDMDALAPELAPLWDALETICVTGCCGIDALDLSPEQLAAARPKLDTAAICSGLLQIQARLNCPDLPVAVSQRLNQYLDRNAARQLIVHLLHHLGA